MKNILITLTAFLLIGCSTVKKIDQQKQNSIDLRVAELKNIGWSEKASIKIAYVEFGILKANREYNGFIND